jgi:predicted RNase H-related nuclease YkuK (DUF458 family)
MSLHINRFVDRIKAADARQQRDFTMSMGDAKDLHADITKLLLALQTLHEQGTSATQNPTVELEVTGGTF